MTAIAPVSFTTGLALAVEEALNAAMNFERDGAELHAGGALDVLGRLEGSLAQHPDRPGERLWNVDGLAELLDPSGAIGRFASPEPARLWRPVRAILFDKSATNNWRLGWHQDRTIVVRRRVEVPGFGPWTTKRGLQHVAPPLEVLNEMVTLRVHLDPVPADNAPLLVAPGSHRLGRIAERDIAAVVRRCGVRACLADAGDIWRYATPILHASDAAAQPRRRRVLQVDYAPGTLPGGLEWLGV